MPFGVVRRASRRMGVLDGVEIVEGEGTVLKNKCGASHRIGWNSMHEGRRRDCSQITLGFLVIPPYGVWVGH